MKRRTLITIALLATALTVWLVVYLFTAEDNSRFAVVSDGPLDIRLWGIRPDAGDAIYDPNGKKIQETLGIALSGDEYSGEKFQRVDFIFEVPTEMPLRLVGTPRIKIAGEDRQTSGSRARFSFDYDGRALLWVRATLPRTFKRSVLKGLWISDTKLNAVDIKVEYYYGSVDSPGFVLQGPFEPNSTVSSPDGILEFSFTEHADRRGDRIAHIVLRAPEYWNEREPIIIYDASGNRHSAITREIRRNSPSSRLEFSVHDMSLCQISAIAFGQWPGNTTFRNVNLNVAGDGRRAYPPYLDEIAERLGLPVTAEALTQYNFRSAGEALKVIDIVRDKSVLRAVEALSYPESRDKLDLRNLTNEEAARLRQTLRRWVAAMDPQIRAFAVETGLLCNWPEFVDPALELLERPVRRAYGSTRGAQSVAVAALERHADELSDEQIGRIADLLASQSQREIVSRLRRLVERLKIEERVEAFHKPAD